MHDRKRFGSTTMAAILAAIVAVLLAACSIAEGETPSASGDPSAAQAASGTDPADTQSPAAAEGDGVPPGKVDPRRGGLDVGFGEFAITLEADEIRPGPVTFVIRNGGALVHGFEIEREDDDGDHSGPGNGELKLEGPEFGPNDVVRIHANLPPGVYELECFVADHDDRGMRATLIVRRGAPLIRQESASGDPDAVSIADFAFTPDRLEVEPGTEVTWTNEDPTAHTVTAGDGSFDSGTLEDGARFSFRFDRPGTFGYACVIHPTMRGTVRVA
jgi:plastocyanin